MSDDQSPDSKPENISRRKAIFTAAAGLGGLYASAHPATVNAASQLLGNQTDRPLKGKVAIVTGARANMGRAFCESLAMMGANVVIHYHRTATKNQALETAQLVEKAGSDYELVSGNLGQLKNVKKLYNLAEEKFGGVDIVINNAGAITKKPLAEFTDKEFARLDEINHKALFYSLREASRRLRNNGRIINNATSLLAGAAPGYAVYAATKASAEEYSRMLAKELGSKKITVNCIAPGPVNTPFFHGEENAQSVAYATNLSAEKRLGEVSDIVPLVSFLASSESQWVNGQTLFINGGYLTR